MENRVEVLPIRFGRLEVEGETVKGGMVQHTSV